MLALVLRFAYLDLIPFAAQAANQLFSSAAVSGGRLALHGITDASGVTQPALGTYLYSIPLIFGHDPRWAAAFTALLNVSAMLIAFIAIQRWFGIRAAVFAIIMWAVNPWAILQSRAIGVGALAPIFCVLVFAGLELGFHRKQPAGWLLAWLSAWLLVNLSLYYWPALAVMVIISFCYWRRVSWPMVLLACGLGLLLLVPYLYYESYIQYHDFLAIFDPSELNRLNTWGIDAVLGAVRTVSSLGISRLAGSESEVYVSHRLPFSGLEGATAVIFIAGVLLTVVRTFIHLARWQDRNAAIPYVFLWLWIGLCVLILAFQPVRDGMDDLALYAPIGFITLGCILADLFTSVVERLRMSRPARIVMVTGLSVGLVALLLWPAYLSLNLFSFINRTTLVDGYGLPLRFWRQTAEVSWSGLRPRRERTLYVVGGSDGGADYQTTSLRYLLPESVEVVNLCPDDGRCLVLPLSRTNLHLLLQPKPEPWTMLEQISARELAIATQPDKEYSAHLFMLAPVSVTNIIALMPYRELWSIDDGPLFLGYAPAFSQPGKTRLLTTFWSFQDAERSEPHGLATRIYSGRDTLDEDRLTVGINEQYWTLDKILVRWLPVSYPFELNTTYRLQIGLYRLPDLVMNRTMNESTGVPGTAIELLPVLE